MSLRTLLAVALLLGVLPLLLGKKGGAFRFDYVERHGREIWVGYSWSASQHFYELYAGEPDLDALVGPRVHKEHGKAIGAKLLDSKVGLRGARLNLGNTVPDPSVRYTAVWRNLEFTYAYGMDVSQEVIYGGSRGVAPITVWLIFLTPVLVSVFAWWFTRRCNRRTGLARR